VIPLRKVEKIGNPVIGRNDVTRIFSNVDLIVNVNQELLVSLEDRIASWSDQQLIGDVFLELVCIINHCNKILINIQTDREKIF
jgi:hypothetical protein